MTSANDIRDIFIRFFERKNHACYDSSSVVPDNDQSLLFVNAGMNQFKSLFTKSLDEKLEIHRAVNSQKCIRAGGKHNDLDNVGDDTYHHTFFEMLGNWSFGDYYKKDAIGWAYEFLTDQLNLDKNRLYVSYFGGDTEKDLGPDHEARDIWIDVGMCPDRVLPYGSDHNFWTMGISGPCGPCTEIHYDRIGKGRDASKLVNTDDRNVIEIWNIVFVQYNMNSDGSLSQLPRRSVDCGMGLERLVSIVQDKLSNYDTELFTPIFDKISKITGTTYTCKIGADDVDGKDTAYRVIADHVRTLTVAISDGCVPSNVGRGYVLRRILRRAVNVASDKLKCDNGMLSSLVDDVVDILGDTYRELIARRTLVKEIINEEETRYVKTLTRGRAILEKYLHTHDVNTISTDVLAQRMYDTYGLPIDNAIQIIKSLPIK